MSAEILRDLAFAKATFQLRTLELILRGPAIAIDTRQGGDAKQAPSRSDESAAIAQSSSAQPNTDRGEG